jgi:hypothetical protein
VLIAPLVFLFYYFRIFLLVSAAKKPNKTKLEFFGWVVVDSLMADGDGELEEFK